MYERLLSETAISNLYTMGCTARVDPRQELPCKPYTVPPVETRMLRAQLILEEALETVKALGFRVEVGQDELLAVKDAKFANVYKPDLEEIIDGCCDIQYVTVGTLVACGVCDLQHMKFVNKANDAKFPGGKAVADEHGKFQKPDGWKRPKHLNETVMMMNLRKKSEELVKQQCWDDEDSE